MNPVTTFTRPLRLWCFVLALLAVAATTLAAQGRLATQLAAQQQQKNETQGQADDVELSADEIIQILRENPDVLADAKAEIVAQLRDRGYPITDRELSDDRLFGQIRSDERARKAMSDQLKARGFAGSGEAEPQSQQQQAPANARPTPSPTQTPNNQQQAPREQRRRGAGQSEYPLRNLPAMRDLYTQALNNPVTLERFGTALFRNSVATAEKSPEKSASDVPVGPDYVIGPGDELVVEYWGRTTQRLTLNVDREGRILLPEAGGLVVAGRTLGDAQQIIQKLLTRQFKDITVDVTLGKLRSVRVYVVGDVKNPGAYDISSLSTALSALIAAGGPTDTGSYRLLKHFRGKNLVDEIDLYELMLHGVTSAQIHIETGDSILVPPVGAQVTVSGSVRRPAIYELHHEQTLDQILDLAGGVPVSGQLNNVKVERIEAHARKEMLSVNLPQGGGADGASEVQAAFKRVQVKDGDIVTVSPILPFTNQVVYLQGHVFRPGKYPFQQGLKVTDVIASFNDLLPEPADRAEIVRLHAPELSPTVIGFNLRDVLEKKVAPPVLQPFDTIRVMGRYDVDAPKVSIYGEVLRPGEYPLSDRMTAVDLVRIAGGFKRGAYQESADLSSYSIANGEKVELDHRTVAIARALGGEADTDVVLKPGDVLTIRQIGGWLDIGGAINLSGEVLHPGRYGILQGERLSAIIKRAGGFSADAYPYGAVLERAQVREFSAKNRDEMIARLQDQGGATTRTTGAAATSRQTQQLIDQIKQIAPNGRLLIHITTDVAKWENTAADVEVRPGDSFIIPKRPNFIMVAGQVYNAAAITFSQGKHAGWYLRQAGGPTSVANKKDIFVIRANGTVVGKGSGEWWSGGVTDALLQPGDTIYVPDKIAGSGLLKNAGQYVQIVSGVAVAASVIRTF